MWHVFKLKGGVNIDVSVPEPYCEKRHLALMEQVHLMSEWKDIICRNAEFLKSVVGQDMMMQRKPYLRIARPEHPEDNIGIHRDTDYGADPREWVCWIPLVDCTDGAELMLLPGSDEKPLDYYPWHVDMTQAVEKGSDKNRLGFLYYPKKLDKEVEDQCIPVPVKFGEALLFSAAHVHGQNVNTAPWTRVSIDIRLAPKSVSQRQNMHGDLYETV